VADEESDSHWQQNDYKVHLKYINQGPRPQRVCTTLCCNQSILSRGSS
jgi:hypothetical protein